MINDLNAIKDFLFVCLDNIVLIYFANGLMSIVFAIFIINKVSKLIDKLR